MPHQRHQDQAQRIACLPDISSSSRARGPLMMIETLLCILLSFLSIYSASCSGTVMLRHLLGSTLSLGVFGFSHRTFADHFPFVEMLPYFLILSCPYTLMRPMRWCYSSRTLTFLYSFYNTYHWLLQLPLLEILADRVG